MWFALYGLRLQLNQQTRIHYDNRNVTTREIRHEPLFKPWCESTINLSNSSLYMNLSLNALLRVVTIVRESLKLSDQYLQRIRKNLQDSFRNSFLIHHPKVYPFIQIPPLFTKCSHYKNTLGAYYKYQLNFLVLKSDFTSLILTTLLMVG